MAQHLVHAIMTGFIITYIADVSICIPAAPPGRNVTKYHMRASSCAAEQAITTIYPNAPPTVNVKNKVASMDPKYTIVNGSRSGTSMPMKCA
eukprot:CAMPEP_0178598136 /NCGR_PEP_ID=MMETSP0697-20121206/32578_1 /TAXON_ID=265572 /ORGANISM="Extubocellulus spinifer, Strain CCMP396" /LENGTH=91 /DNA_ID=CAMNT_0020235877 /DNA_START=166 /DNA_END=441 /DNA_ORIENTATION=+